MPTFSELLEHGKFYGRMPIKGIPIDQCPEIYSLNNVLYVVQDDIYGPIIYLYI